MTSWLKSMTMRQSVALASHETQAHCSLRRCKRSAPGRHENNVQEEFLPKCTANRDFARPSEHFFGQTARHQQLVSNYQSIKDEDGEQQANRLPQLVRDERESLVQTFSCRVAASSSGDENPRDDNWPACSGRLPTAPGCPAGTSCQRSRLGASEREERREDSMSSGNQCSATASNGQQPFTSQARARRRLAEKAAASASVAAAAPLATKTTTMSADAPHKRQRQLPPPAVCVALVALLCLLLDTCAQRAAAASSLQQYFEVQPEAQYLVQTGQEIRLRCLIRNRQGECVWLRNGRVVGPIARKYSFAKTPDDGDCSLLVRNTSVALDDGHWQCQVLSPELDQEPLQSRDVHLLVLVPPERPQIKNLSQGAKLILEEKKEKNITCEMRGGNPAPRIEWYLDGKNITKESQQTSTNGAQQATSGSTQTQSRITQSKLRLNDIKRSMNGKNLTCVGVHQTVNQSALAELDVQYLPTVSVIQREYSIVEGSPLSINCLVDSNPPPSLVNWRLVGDGSSQRQKSTTSNDKEALIANKVGPVLEFERIGREYNQNVFECMAQNAHGISTPTDIKLNVLYAPFLVNTSHSESIRIGQDAKLMCLFEGNPQPEIKWLYTDPMSKSASAHLIDTSAMSDKQLLLIRNSTYRNEGDYHCEARNTINGQPYAVRSSNIILDIYGEPQFLAKKPKFHLLIGGVVNTAQLLNNTIEQSPVHSKVVQGTKSDISLTFCSDPPPFKVYWQYGSIRIEVSRVINLGTGLAQPLQGSALGASGQLAPPGGLLAISKQQASLASRFQAQPLQPLQKRDSFYSKVPTCYESTLSLLDPELNDQRDYQLMVFNDQGHATGSIRLRVTSPLSPALMISSAFVTIFGLFLCSLLFMFAFKRRQQFMAAAATGAGGAASGGHTGNGRANGNSANGGANGPAHGGKTGDENDGGKSKANGYTLNHHLASQTKGMVNGTGNGLANGASNPCGNVLNGADQSGADQAMLSGKHNNLLSMASSDTSCNDQKQLLSSNSSDRTTNSSTSNSGPAGASNEAFHQASDRSSTNSTPTIPLTHISIDDELQINGSYQATESVTHGARLSPLHATNSKAANGALIYANIDYGDQFGLSQPVTIQQLQRPANKLRRLQTPVGELDSPTSSQHTVQEQQLQQANNGSPPISMHQRTSVGATIAMMNSLAAAAATAQQSSPGQGVLNGAINQQLNMRGQNRKQGPPKPPKPSIQQRSRFYQQQMQQQQQQHNHGLVMIGAPPSGTLNEHGEQQQVVPGQDQRELVLEYSRLAFPARAEL